MSDEFPRRDQPIESVEAWLTEGESATRALWARKRNVDALEIIYFLSAARREVHALRAWFVPQDIVLDLLRRLDAAGCGKPGAPFGNTLHGMVQEIIAAREQAQDFVRVLTGRCVDIRSEVEAAEARLTAERAAHLTTKRQVDRLLQLLPFPADLTPVARGTDGGFPGGTP